jgi:hypothetical protein
MSCEDNSGSRGFGCLDPSRAKDTGIVLSRRPIRLATDNGEQLQQLLILFLLELPTSCSNIPTYMYLSFAFTVPCCNKTFGMVVAFWDRPNVEIVIRHPEHPVGQFGGKWQW